MVYNSNIFPSNASPTQTNNSSGVMVGLRQPTQTIQAPLSQSGATSSILDTNQYGTVTDYSAVLAPKPSNHLVAKAAVLGGVVALLGPLAVPMLGNMAKNLLPQAGNIISGVVNSGVAKEIVGNVVGGIASNAISNRMR